ncbi:arylsulfatase B [Trichonephila clavipes]|nr:arylsulfatase B [Trichonephila clavipes]
MRNPGRGQGLPPLFPFHQSHERTCGSTSILSTPHATKALYIYKHPCLLRDSHPGPTASMPHARSRVAFMTGYYPYRVGRQNHVLNPLVPTGVPLRFAFLPEKLKEIGYSTHLIGK